MDAFIDRSVLDRVIPALKKAIFRCDREITAESRLVEDLKLGRIGRMKFGICLEQVFDIEMQDEVLERAITVADVVRYLSRRYHRDVDFLVSSEAEHPIRPNRLDIF